MIVEVKLTHRTAKGTLVRSPATLEYAKGRIKFIKSPFGLKDEIKAMRGSRWHGFDDERAEKCWSVEDCPRNRFQLAFLMGEDVYEWFDRDLIRHEYQRPLMPHQCDLADSGLTYHYQLWAAEMGCVEGDATIHVNRCGRGFKMALRDLYNKFHGATTRGRRWDQRFPTFVRSLCGDTLRLNPIVNVLYKGIKPVFRLTVASGKTVRLTADHEVATDYDAWTATSELKAGDTVLSNGKWVDKDGYVRVGGLKWKHPRWTTGGVYEHILVMEEKLGRPLAGGERVHHDNEIRHDNRPDNLILMASDSEHATLHGREGGFRKLHGGRNRVCFVPEFDTVVSVEPAGETDVYDIVCADPHRNFVANGVVVHNCGKTLSAQEVIERSGVKAWFWIGPKTSLPNMRREFKKWGFPFDQIHVEFMTYEALVRIMDDGIDTVPQGVIFDESSRCKGDASQRTKAAQMLADLIREKYGYDGYVIEMSGTPAPKSPGDWWSQCEIAWPGFLKEGSRKALEQRCGIMRLAEYDSGSFNKRVGWKDDERKCATCGEFAEAHDVSDDHLFVPTKNEIAYLYERLKGLVVIKHVKDCITLPEKRYRKIICKPTLSTLRVAKALMEAAPNTITGLTWLRELSDGFQYRDRKDGKLKCPHCTGGTVDEWFLPGDEDRSFASIDMLDLDLVTRLQKRKGDCPRCLGTAQIDKIVRETREVPCPKDKAVKQLLEECEESGRLVLFAGFTGSIDRLVKLCRSETWNVVRCDGGHFQAMNVAGEVVTSDGEASLDYWADRNNSRVAFVANPESGGLSLTLTESRKAVFFSNTFKPEFRAQAEARIHRMGQNAGCEIVDLIHLPSDERVLSVLKENRRVELLTLGEVWTDTLDESGLEVIE